MRILKYHTALAPAAVLCFLVVSTTAFSTHRFTSPMFHSSQRALLHATRKSVPCTSRFVGRLKPLCSQTSNEGEIESIPDPSGSSKVGPIVDALLGKTISRAMSTISDEATSASTTQPQSGDARSTDVDTENIIDAVVSRASEQITKTPEVDVEESSSVSDSTSKQKNHEDKRKYLDNPAVTPTALAHSFWGEVVQPYQDIIIDATAGNGKDSLVLASMLFPANNEDRDMISSPNRDNGINGGPRLMCIDIQQRACENTLDLLRENLDSDIVDQYIDILHSSHAPLPSLEPESVGLVCYNLGYLPGADKEAFQTQMVTTIYSLADAAILLRDGGLLSVMSYPGNGWIEHCAVNYFMEGLAMFSSKRKDGWEGYVDSIPSDYDLELSHGKMYGDGQTISTVEQGADSIRETVRLALERVKVDGFEQQTWRVFDHRPLGRPLSPIMYSAMRIK